MKLRSLQLVILAGMLAALFMASGLSAQEDVGNLALTATALAGGGSGGPVTITPLPSLTPGGPAVDPSTPGLPNQPTVTRPPNELPTLTPLPSLTPAGAVAATSTTVPANPQSGLPATLTPLPSLTPGGPGFVAPTADPANPAAVAPPGLAASLTPLPSLTPGGPAFVTATPVPADGQAVTPLPSLTPGLGATLTPLPSLTPMGTPAPTEPPTAEPTAVPSVAPSLTPLPTLTPAAGAGDGSGTTSSGDLAPVVFEVPYVTAEQEPPAPPASAAGMGTLILLMGLGGATVIGLLMLARDRYRDHREE